MLIPHNKRRALVFKSVIVCIYLECHYGLCHLFGHRWDRYMDGWTGSQTARWIRRGKLYNDAADITAFIFFKISLKKSIRLHTLPGYTPMDVRTHEHEVGVQHTCSETVKSWLLFIKEVKKQTQWLEVMAKSMSRIELIEDETENMNLTKRTWTSIWQGTPQQKRWTAEFII